MPQTHSSNGPFTRDPSAPLGSLQNPYPPGAGPDGGPALSTPMHPQSARYVVQTPYFQQVRPQNVASGALLPPHPHGSRSPSPLPPLLGQIYLQTRPPSPIPPEWQEYVDVYSPSSRQIRRPSSPYPPSQLQLEPPIPQLQSQRVHFNQGLIDEDTARERAARTAIARLNALATSGHSHASGEEPDPSARTPLPTSRNPPPSALEPQRHSSVPQMARAGGRRVGTLPAGSLLTHDDGILRDLYGQIVPSQPGVATQNDADGIDGGAGSANPFDDYVGTVTDALIEPPMWELCAMCNDRPHSIKDKGSRYCWACYGDICAAERAQPWERCSICEDKPGVHQQDGSWFCKGCYGEACAAEKKHRKVMARGR